MPAGPQMYPGANNTFIQDHSASNFLVTQYSRNVKDFPLNRYIQYQETKKSAGLFLVLDVEQAGRLVNGQMNEHHWADGADRPRTHNGTEKFNWHNFLTERYNFNTMLGWKSRDQADWDLQDVELANAAQRAMTARARRVNQLLEDNTNWDADHRIDVTTIPGVSGRWDQSTTQRSDIKRCINYAVDVIRKNTLSVVKKKSDMILVMNARTAQRIGETQEMINAFIQSKFAMEQFTAKGNTYDNYGLPSHLYEIEVVVEDTVMVTSPRDAATVVRQDVCADGVAYLLSRPGGLTSKVNLGPNYSTITSFQYEDMTVETQDDDRNRRTEIHIVDDTDEVMTAPVSGFKFENIVN